MKEVAPNLWLLDGFPPDAFNVYLAGDVLIDAGTRWAKWRILRQLRGRPLSLVALTHCHPDHQGAAKAVCEAYGVKLACHEADVPAMEERGRMEPRNRLIALGEWFWSGPPHPVGRVLRDGDEVAGFRVVHTPGHTPGHVLFFRESDRVALVGDLLRNLHFLSGKAELGLPPPFFCSDPHQNARSVQKLVDLRPSLVCFGHGPPLADLELLDDLAGRVAKRLAAAEAAC